MTDFLLDSRLQNDTVTLRDLPLCRVLLSRDANYPWLILVPRISGIREIIELSDNQQQQLQKESNLVAEFLLSEFSPDKLNIAALGNVVEQLHIHHIARYRNDPSWPAPIWNAVPATQYNDEKVNVIKDAFALFCEKRRT